MDVVTQDQHKALGFVSACVNSGYRPTHDDVGTWLDNPEATPPQWNLLGASVAQFQATFARAFSTSGGITPGETVVEHLVRIKWLVARGGGLELTPLGSALFAHAERATFVDAGPTVVVLGQDDPLAYPRLVGVLADAGKGFLVDPYLKLDQLHLLIVQTQIERVLVKKSPETTGALAAMSALLGSSLLPRQILVRASSDKLHDRLIVGANGQVQTIGASMNTVERGTATVISPMPAEATAVLLKNAEAQWNAATPLIPAVAVPPPKPKPAAKPRGTTRPVAKGKARKVT
jgi:hypothetical protein